MHLYAMLCSQNIKIIKKQLLINFWQNKSNYLEEFKNIFYAPFLEFFRGFCVLIIKRLHKKSKKSPKYESIQK